MEDSSDGLAFPLPGGWAATRLADITKPSSLRVSPGTREAARFVGLKHVEAHTTRLLGSEGAASAGGTAKAFHAGDVLYGRLRSYLNKVCQPNFGGLCSGEFIVLPPTDAVHGRFLMYRLNAGDFVSFADRANTGDRPRVAFGHLGDFPFALPPFTEQARIADALDMEFARLDAGMSALKRAEDGLSRYRASVLRAAIDGSLTADWREQNPDVEPAERLLSRIRVERRRHWEQEQLRRYEAKAKRPPKNWRARYRKPVAPDADDLPDLPRGWRWVTVAQCSGHVRYGSSAKTTTDSAGVPVLRMGNLTTDGHLSLSDLKFLPRNHPEFPDLLLEPGDLLFNRTNSAELVGKTAMYRGSPATCSLASYLIRVRLLPGVLPEFVASCLNGELGRRWIKRVANQTVGQANVNGTKLAAFAFPLPPYAEQKEIAKALSEMDEGVLSLRATVEQQRAGVRSLRQSLLRCAFAGRLVPQDPDDEPASALLRRIAAHRRSPNDDAKLLKKRRKGGPS